MLEKILEIHKQGKLEEAEGGYRELLALSPDDPEALHLLGMVRRQRGDIREGMALVGKAVGLMPERANYHLTLGGLQLHARLLDQAKASFERALKLNPNLHTAYSALGQIAMLQNDADGAERQFKLALLARPDDAQVLTSYGNWHFQRGDVDRALQYLARAAQLTPNDAATQASLGRAYLKKGMFAFAEQALRNALQLRPDFPAAQLALAEALIQQSRPAEAQAIFEALLATGQLAARAQLGLGELAQTRGDLGAAAGHYRSALAVDPAHANARAALVRCLWRQNQVDAALDVYRERLRQSPEDAVARNALGSLEATLGLNEEAVATFQAGLQHVPQDRNLRIGLASMLEAVNDLDGAEREAIQLPANDAVASLILARAALRRGDAAKARKLLDGLGRLQLTAVQARQHAHLSGHALDRLELPAEAIAAWLNAQRLLPQTALPPLAPLPAPYIKGGSNIAATSETVSNPAPVFLLGAPGSGVDRVAALLGDQATLALLDDRLYAGTRHDWLSGAEAAYPDLTDHEAQILGRRYRRGVERLRLPASKTVVDWLPMFDAGNLPALALALPGARFIVVGGDPRDSLLNWLAYGCAQGFVANAIEPASNWLALALAHLGALLEADAANCLRLIATTNAEAWPDMAKRLQDFLDLPELVPGPNYARAEQMLGGLAPALPEGHYRRYAQTLDAAFQALVPVE